MPPQIEVADAAGCGAVPPETGDGGGGSSSSGSSGSSGSSSKDGRLSVATRAQMQTPLCQRRCVSALRWLTMAGGGGSSLLEPCARAAAGSPLQAVVAADLLSSLAAAELLGGSGGRLCCLPTRDASVLLHSCMPPH